MGSPFLDKPAHMGFMSHVSVKSEVGVRIEFRASSHPLNSCRKTVFILLFGAFK